MINLKLHNHNKHSFFKLILLFFLVSGNCIVAQNNWDGDNAVGNFTFNNNWYSDVVPGTWNGTTDLIFNFNNGNHASMYYDFAGWVDAQTINFISTYPRSVIWDSNGNGVNFYVKFENNCASAQTIRTPLSYKGASNAQVNPVNGDLTFDKYPIYNDNNKNFEIYGNNSKLITFGTIVAGSQEGYIVGNSNVNLYLKQYSKVLWDVNNTAAYSGGTFIENGEFWIGKSGKVNGTTIQVGNGNSNTCKLFLSDASIATTATNSIVVPTSSTNSYIGGLNSSNTHIFSGVVNLNNNTVNLEEVSSTGTLLLSGAISGTGGIKTVGLGTVRLSSTSNSYTGSTTTQAGVLQLGASGVIPNASPVVLNGGTFSTGATTGFTETAGTLQLTNSSTLALGTGGHTLTFAASNAVAWTAARTLTITGWNAGCSSSVGKIFVGSSAAALTAVQLAQIQFLGYTAGATLLSTGELIPGNVTVNATSATLLGNYSTVKAAFDAINLGTHKGTIVISINADTTEAASAVLNASSAPSSYTSILMQPAGCGGRTVSGSIAAALIDLNGADVVTIDGLNSGGNSLTIASNNVAGQAIRFINDATSNTIKRCTISAGTTSATSGAIVFSTGTIVGNDNNTIDNNSIKIFDSVAGFLTNGIYSSGSTASTTLNNSGITISNNNIFDIFPGAGVVTTGLLVSSGNTDWTISGNSIYIAAFAPSSITLNGITINNSSSGNNFQITGNYIGGATSLAASGITDLSAAGTNVFNGISLSVGTATASLVQNNTIARVFCNTQNGGTFNGVNVTAGAATLNNNTIGINSGSVTGAANGGIGLNQNTSTQTSTVFSTGILNTSAATVNITNNTVAGVAMANNSSNTLVSNFIGIRNNAAASACTITGNTIKNITSVQASGGSTNISKIYGISQENTGAITVTITGNTVSNLAYTTSSGSTAVTIWGVLNLANTSTVNISTNQINNLLNNSANTGTGSTASVIGVFNQASSGNISINGNIINTLKNTNTGAGTYSLIGVRTIGNNSSTFNKNIINSLSAASSVISQLYGLQLTGGTWAISNNMVRLGINEVGASVVGNYDIQGINASLGTNTLYHNSIYIGGASSGSQITYALQAASSSTVKNNILVNRRTSATANTQIALLFGASTVQDNNLYYVDGVNGGLIGKTGATTCVTLNALQATAAGRDLNSANSDPKFIDAISGTPNLHITTGVATEVESGGATGTGITDDIDADIRFGQAGYAGTGTAPDIGADESDFTPTDFTPPVITATSITNPTTTTAPTQTVAISDNKALNVTVGTKPRMYYKKCSDSNTIINNVAGSGGWKYVEATNAVSPFSFTPNYSLLGGVTTGTFINYFYVAQDSSANVSLFTSGVGASASFASTPTSVSLTTANLPATGFSSYVIQITGGTFTAGTGGAFVSITGECGCFQAVNASAATMNSNVIVNVISDLTETGTYQLTSSGIGNAFTTTIQPDATTLRTISGTLGGSSPAFTTNSAMIGVTTFGKLIINGGSGSNKYITLRNTNATPANTWPVAKIIPGANTDVVSLAINNSIIEGNSTDTSLGEVYAFGSFAGSYTLNLDSCDFRDARGGTTGQANGAVSVNCINLNMTLNNNNMYNFAVASSTFGVINTVTSVKDVTITNNKIYNENSVTFPMTSTWAGIRLAGVTGTMTVTGNTIGGSDATAGGSALAHTGNAAIFGITATSTATGVAHTISNNTVKNITTSSNSAGIGFTGITFAVASATVKSTISGNTVSGISATNAAGTTFTGIALTAGIADFTNNTVGDLVTANSINHSGSGQFYGINAATSVTTAIIAQSYTGNTVANVTSKFRSTGFSSYAMYYKGAGTNTCTVQNNIVKTIKFTNTATTTSAATLETIGLMVDNANNFIVGGSGNPNTIDGITSDLDNVGIGVINTIGISTASSNTSGTISYNVVKTISNTGTNSLSARVKGILNNNGNLAVPITNNTVSGLSSAQASIANNDNGTSASMAVVGIQTNVVNASQNISNNTIYDLNSTAATAQTRVIGIATNAQITVANSAIAANKIYDLRNQSAHASGLAQVNGINLNFGGSSAANTVNVYNNFISLNNGSNANNMILAGIRLNATSGNQNATFNYNSVHIYGTASGSQNSYAFLRSNTNVSFVNSMKNNIFQNIRTGGTGKHIAIGNIVATPGTGWNAAAVNYNDLYATTSTSIGEWGSGTVTDFATWKTNSGQDANSISVLANFTTPSTGDLHLIIDANCALDGTGTSLAAPFTTDYDAAARAANPDIGADEFTSTYGLTVTPVALSCNVANADLTTAVTALSVSTPALLTYWTDATATTSPVATPTSVPAGTYYIKYGSCTPPKTVVVSVQAAIYNSALYSGNTPANWSVAPDTNKALIFNSSFTSAGAGLGNLSGCNCTVNSPSVVTIASGDTMTLQNEITVSGGSITFNNTASLLQTVGTTNTNMGDITYIRTTRAMRTYDYVYWGSPITKAGSFAQIPSAFDRYYKFVTTGGVNGTYTPLTTDNIPGQGYITRVKSDPLFTPTPSAINYPFVGIPNNGVININATNYDATSLVSGNTILLGNPYPSAIDADAFIAANIKPGSPGPATITGTINQTIGGALYFWTSNTVYPGTGSYNFADYCTYTKLGIANGAPGTSVGGLNATGKIAAGQGFFAQIFASGPITFNNSMRVAANNTNFFRNANETTTIEKHRIWLNYTNATSNSNKAFRQMLVGYADGATNGIDNIYDGHSFTNNQIDLYSIVVNENFSVQARALPFQDTDLVPLGFKATTAGDYTISIDHVDGLFELGQPIFLEDKLLNIIYDLRQAPYSFTTAAGRFDDRFVLRYTNTALGNPNFETLDNSVIIAANHGELTIKSSIENMQEVTVYDILGRQLFDAKNINNTNFVNSNISMSQQALIVKIKLANGYVVTRKIIL